MVVTTSAEGLGFPINQSVAFSNHKGVFKEKLKKRQITTLKPVIPMLRQFLEPGEEILLAMRGCSPMSFMEQFTTGWIIYYIKRCVLVVTNRRILHIPTKKNYSPRHSIAQIRFGDVDTIKPSTFLGRFTVKYKNGSKEIFHYVKDVKKFKAVLNDIGMTAQQPTGYGIRHHLCPKCTTPLTAGEYVCPSCRLEFKNEKKARTLSIVLPGGGYFYTGHPVLGIGDAIVESILIMFLVTGLAGLVFRAESEASLPIVIVFGFFLFLEKLYTVYHAKHYIREYIPVDKEIQPLRK